jgi:hypothetical protein
VQLKTENTEIEDTSLVAVWQPHVGPEPMEKAEWCDTSIDTPSGPF